MKSKNIPTSKLSKVEKALKTLLESHNSKKPEVKKAINKLTNVRTSLKETSLTTATINQKDPRKEDTILNVDPADQSTLNTLKSMKNTADITVAGRRLEEQDGRSYTSEEAEAVGKALLKPLITATRDTQGEIGEEPTVTGETNKFSIHLVYGHDGGEDIFHFTLEAPTGEETTSGKVYMDLKSGKEEVVSFEVTEANEVKFNPQVNLEERLKDLLVKYTAANTKEPRDIDNFIAERKQALRESFGQESIDEVKGNFTIQGLGNFEFVKMEDGFVTGSQKGTIKTFRKEKVQQDNPDFFKPAPRAPRPPRAPKPPKMSEKEYWNLLQGAVDDEGTNRYAHDMAESMILDDRLVRYLKSEYPDLRTPEDFLERLQWDLEACEPEGENAYGYDDDEDEIVPEVTKHVGDKYVNYPEHGGKRLGTFDTKSAAQKQLAAIEISKHKNESVDEDFDIGHEDNEPHMLKAELYKVATASAELYKMLSTYEGKGEVDFPQWWQTKIIQAAENIKCAKEYLEFETVEPQVDAAINTLG